MPQFNRNYTALIVEENIRRARVLQTALNECGITRVTMACGLSESMELLQKHRFDVVLCDWTEADSEGLLVLESIRNPLGPVDLKLPVIILSGDPSLNRVTRARDAGATEFAAKPLSVATLEKVLHSALERRRPFIADDSYIGPDRRRRQRPVKRPRRASDGVNAIRDNDVVRATDPVCE